jgi:hypothetical protein
MIFALTLRFRRVVVCSGDHMALAPHPNYSAQVPPRVDDVVDDAALERVMREVPSGALALSLLTVGLLLLAWFLMYAFVFLPRGMVG